MNVLAEVHRSLQTMGFTQLIAAFAFMGGYVAVVSDFFGDAGRARVWLLTLGGGIAFCMLTAPWMHGVLLLALFVGTVGLFTAFVALTSRLLGMSEARIESTPLPEPDVAPAPQLTRSVASSLPVEPA